MATSFLARLKGVFAGSRDRGPLVGTWKVVEISVPHPFGHYALELGADGSQCWTAIVPTSDGGEYRVQGSGTWHTTKSTFEYTSGAASGTLRYALEDEQTLVLDGLPATQVGPGVRCVLKKE